MSEYKRIIESGNTCGVLMPEVWQQRLRDSTPRTQDQEDQIARAEKTPPAPTSAIRRDVCETIEHEIVPRLMMTHKIAVRGADIRDLNAFSISQQEIEHFAAMAVTQGFGISYAYIDSLRDRDARLQDIFLKLLSPAAQYLGRLWEQDLCDFIDVTIGLGVLQQLVRALSAESGFTSLQAAGSRSVLLSASPGEQHTFGIMIVSEFFHRAGWNVTTLNANAGAEIVRAVRAERFDVVGLSASSDGYGEATGSIIKDIRKLSRNKTISIMVGGYAFQSNPGLITQVGANVSALNGREALHNASKLLDTITHHTADELLT